MAVLAAVALAPSPAGAATTGVECTYYLSQWRGGFMADILMVNNGPAIDGWTVRWSFAHPTQIGATWNAALTQTPDGVATAVNASWNAVLPTGRSLVFGWSGVAAATEIPTDITVNGVPC
ncbi:hypothetical protein GCM10009681_39590 [Luedemannella helvata]|uniref:CBM2 domain-containing protein n=1 Tax=Luedemannella helvata TaxID=349315 RepID=A0ABP4WW96_9ACTN